MSKLDHQIYLYPNRRMFDRSTHRFVTLEQLIQMMDQGIGFSVWDQKTGADLTQKVLVRLLCERAMEAGPGDTLLTNGVLRRLIGIDSAVPTSFARDYLDHSMRMFGCGDCAET